MNSIIVFTLGMVIGSISTFYGIMKFAETRDKSEKQKLINKYRSKYRSKH